MADSHGADLPALASDLPAVASNLPALAANLPAAKPARGGGPAAPASPAMAGGSFELDLPMTAAAGLPVAKGGPGGLDLPVVSAAGLPAIASAAGLPVVSAGLPVVSAGLPSPAAGLPTTAAALPSPVTNLPSPANILPSPANILPVAHAGFGEIDIPSLNEPAPAPRQVPSLGGGGAFGEIRAAAGGCRRRLASASARGAHEDRVRRAARGQHPRFRRFSSSAARTGVPTRTRPPRPDEARPPGA